MPRTTGNVKARAESGAAGSRLEATPKTDYERVRIHEISKRAELYDLKIARLKAEVLDRREVETEFAALMSVIRAIILGSRLSKGEKQDIFRNLAGAADFADQIGEKQKGSDQEEPGVIPGLDGGIDSEI
jgi:hypothetical protein